MDKFFYCDNEINTCINQNTELCDECVYNNSIDIDEEEKTGDYYVER